MPTTTIPWGDGSGDNLYLTYPSASGDQSVSVTSDANGGAARSKVVTFSASGVPSVTLTINQDAGLPYTPLTYIQTDGVAYLDSGIPGNYPKSMEIELIPAKPASGNSYIMGSRKDSGTYTRFVPLLINANKVAGYSYADKVYNSNATGIFCEASLTNQTPMVVRTSLTQNRQTFAIKQAGESDFTTRTTTLTNAITTGKNMYIFALNLYGTDVMIAKSGTKIKSVKIYSNADFTGLIFDGVPCLYNGQYGMWDKVADAFHGNIAGTGSFTGA